jgi:non-specific serine/threonine protein kinase
VAAVAVGGPLGGRIYVIGGLGPNPSDGTRVDIYDPGTDTWAAGPPLPVPTHHTAAVVLGPRIYVLGGYAGSTFTPTSATWSLDTALPPAVQAWQPFIALPQPRGAHAAATDGARIWVFGGVSQGVLEPSALVMEGLPVLAVPLPVWRTIAPFPFPRDHLAGGFLAGKVLAVGGRELTLETNSARLDLYDPLTNTWTQGPSMPTRRGGIAAAPLAGRLWVYGGEAPGGLTFSNAEGYDPVTSSWLSAAPMPHARHGLGAAPLGGAVYVESGGPVAGLTYSGHNERMRLV